MRDLALSLLVGLLVPAPAFGQTPCPVRVNPVVAEAWTLYRGDAIDSAAVMFARALEDCPAHVGATVGHGYALLRLGRIEAAERRFISALETDSNLVDAVMGMGLIAWRRGRDDEARTAFLRVLALDATHREARRLVGTIGVPPERPPLTLPDTLEARSRVRGSGFEVLADGRWQPFYIKGVNLGAALPGRFPSEFPDSAQYESWIAQIAAMGANAIRVYTIHPPSFYRALERFNRAHAEEPLWLIHGVWTRLPPNHDFADSLWNAEFTAEMHRVVDLLHGRADLPRRSGHASGYYTADVSAWTLAFIIGREWEPYAVQAYNDREPELRDWKGRYLRVTAGSATDVWLGQALERLVAYETERYRVQRPVSYTSWPTLDPLYHATESSVHEDRAMRGIVDQVDTLQHDDDVAAVDPSLLEATADFRAGVFAAYHAYPYYPDFIVLGDGYADYLRRLKRHHADMPVVVAEYGVPASLGIAHLTPEGWHHGGHTEAEMAAIDARLTRIIAGSGMAGGILFAWIDEWFKVNWLVRPLELPRERTRFWLNRMNPEQQYGVLAIEPEPRLRGSTVSERRDAWSTVPPLYGGAVRAIADEAYLRLLVTSPDSTHPDSVLIGLDVLDRGAGSVRWPLADESSLPVGVEFVIVATPTDVRVLAAPGANPYRVRRQTPFRSTPRRMTIDNPPPGLFQGPYNQVPNARFGDTRRAGGPYDSLRVVINRVRLGRDSVEHAAAGYEWGLLPSGVEPDGLWEVDSATGALEIRIPWTLINIADPSSRRVLTGFADGATRFTTQPADDIGVLLAMRSPDGTVRSWPVSGLAADVARFTWKPWDQPRWRVRTRPVFEALREVYRTLGITAEEP